MSRLADGKSSSWKPEGSGNTMLDYPSRRDSGSSHGQVSTSCEYVGLAFRVWAVSHSCICIRIVFGVGRGKIHLSIYKKEIDS